MVGRWQAIEMCRKAGEDRVHVFDVENHDGNAGLRARQGLRGRRRLGQRRQRQLQPALVDARQRALQRRARHDPGPARADATRRGTGEGARTFARDLRLALAREHLDLAADGSEDDDAARPGARSSRPSTSGPTALDAWHEGGRQGPRPPGRLRRAPGRAAAAAHPALGDPDLPPARRPRRPAAAAAPEEELLSGRPVDQLDAVPADREQFDRSPGWSPGSPACAGLSRRRGSRVASGRHSK